MVTSKEVKEIFDAVGEGKVLAIRRNSDGTCLAVMVEPKVNSTDPIESWLVDSTAALEAINSGLMTQLTKDRNNDRAGYLELGLLENNLFEYYKMTQ